MNILKEIIANVYGFARYALPNIGEALRNWQFDRRVAKIIRETEKQEDKISKQ